MPYGRPDILNYFSGVIEDTANKQIKDFSDENVLMELACKNLPNVTARALLPWYNDTSHSGAKTENDIIRLFQLWKLSNRREREDVLKRANENGERLARLMKSPDADTLKTVRQECEAHGNLKRLTLIAYMSAYADDYDKKTYAGYIKLNRAFMTGCVDSLFKYLEGITTEEKITEPKKNFTPAEYEEHIRQLNAKLKHRDIVITQLENDLDEQLDEIRREEADKLMIMLNSSKYGNIIDLLEGAQAGFKQLQKKGPIPFEIKDAKTLIRQLKDFMADCGVQPMFETGIRINVKAADIDTYYYEGAPFSGPDEVKVVEIVSPGWVIPDRGDLVLSQPKVKEIMEDK